MFRTFCCEHEQLSIDWMHRLLKCTKGQISGRLGSAILWLLYNVNCDQQHRKVSCWDIKISYWKSCKRLSRCSLIFFSRSSLCSSKMCFSAQVSCIIPMSQNSHDVTNSKSRKPFRHRLQRFPPMSRSDSGFNHGSRHSIIISITSHQSNHILASFIYTSLEFDSIHAANQKACNALEKRSQGKINLSKLRLL